MTSKIEVCTGVNCGKYKLAKDIEDLAKEAGDCKVKRTGCMAKCLSAPNVKVTLRVGQPRPLEDRYSRVRREGLAKIVQKASEQAKAHRASGSFKPGCHERLSNAFVAFRQKHGWGQPRAPGKAQSSAAMQTSTDNSKEFDSNAESDTTTDEGSDGEKHTYWRIDTVDVVSKWSAIYRCTSMAPAQNVLVPGRQTWHVALFAKIGENSEALIERQYTPISTTREWEQGKCDLLVKIYPDGEMTSWLYSKRAGDELLFSNPRATLQVPSLTVDASLETFSSVLLVVGGTGITAALQVLEQYRIADMQSIPVTLIYSCRKDDVLMAQAIDDWALESSQGGQSRKAIVALTDTMPLGTAPPFPFAVAPERSQLDKMYSALRILDGRVSEDLLFGELVALPKPIRTVVCGPEAMNVAVESMLGNSACADSLRITVLEA